MDEPRFAIACRQYIQMLDMQNNMKPSTWSQDDATREHAQRIALLAEMRDALKE